MNSRKIIVATDFTEQSVAALQYAIYIANRVDAGIELIHVAEKKIVREKVDDKAAYKNKLESLYQQLEDIKMKSGGAFRINTQIRFSNLSFYEEIIDYGVDHAIDLCCLGVSSSAKHDLGENTEILVKKADFPIFTCRDIKTPIQFKNILLPIDITKHTVEKVERMLRFAKEFEATIHLLAVSEFLQEFTSNIGNLETVLENAVTQIRNAGLKCTKEIIKHDYVNNSIAEYTREIDADLLVIMSEEENRLLQLFLPSKVNKVIAESKIPVLSFRPEQED